MKVLVSGASGLLGSTLVTRLVREGHEALRLVRQQPVASSKTILWDPEAGSLNATALGSVDAVVHLAGEPIADGRWSASKKRRILLSREEGTRLLAETAAGMSPQPKVFISASAIGIYGNRGEEVLHEGSDTETGFLASVCRRWEQAAEPIERAGIRGVRLRFGLVLRPNGGLLRKLLPVFRYGLGGRIGDGRQWMSWISLADTVDSILFALRTSEIHGPVNVVAPNPVRNTEFTRILAQALQKPAPWKIPRIAIKARFGEMGTETALSSANVEPRILLNSGFRFRHAGLDGALQELLRRQETSSPDTTH